MMKITETVFHYLLAVCLMALSFGCLAVFSFDFLMQEEPSLLTTPMQAFFGLASLFALGFLGYAFWKAGQSGAAWVSRLVTGRLTRQDVIWGVVTPIASVAGVIVIVVMLYYGLLWAFNGFSPHFLAIDACLDAGGMWDEAARQCVTAPSSR